jgi:hypothetical protein
MNSKQTSEDIYSNLINGSKRVFKNDRIIGECDWISFFRKITVHFTRQTWFDRILANFTEFSKNQRDQPPPIFCSARIFKHWSWARVCVRLRSLPIHWLQQNGSMERAAVLSPCYPFSLVLLIPPPTDWAGLRRLRSEWKSLARHDRAHGAHNPCASGLACRQGWVGPPSTRRWRWWWSAAEGRERWALEEKEEEAYHDWTRDGAWWRRTQLITH